MHYTTTKNPIRLIHITDGVICSFANFGHLVEYWKTFRYLDISLNFKYQYEICDEIFTRYHTHILRDSVGNTIDPSSVKDCYNLLYPYKPKWKGRRHPGSKRSTGYYFRSLRTTQERRQSQIMDEDEPLVRPNRNTKHIPSAWDDIAHGNRHIRNWKRYRMNQWKPR